VLSIIIIFIAGIYQASSQIICFEHEEILLTHQLVPAVPEVLFIENLQ
jgi:hypothetical protein